MLETEDNWCNDVRAENDTLQKCGAMIDNIVENIDIDPAFMEGSVILR